MSASKNRNDRTRGAKPEPSQKPTVGIKSGTKASRKKIAAHPTTVGGREAPSKISGTLQRPSKLEIMISLLRRRGGATLDALSKATGWQAHSVRGALSGAIGKKRGLKILSEKTGSAARTYRIAG